MRQQAELLAKVERQNSFLSAMQSRDVEKLEAKVD